MPWWRSLKHRLIAYALCLAAVMTVLSCTGCAERLFYHPSREVEVLPSARGLLWEALRVTSADGTAISAWRIRAPNTPVRGTVIQCHGNAGNLTGHWTLLDFLPEAGWQLVSFDYRGYGDSEGSPRRPGIVDDAEAVLERVLSWPEAERGPVALVGQSLGGSVALALGRRREGRGELRCMVVESAFTSWRGIAAHTLSRTWILWPVAAPLARLLLRSGADPLDDVPHVGCPKLFIVSEEDKMVPPGQTLAVARAAGDDKEVLSLPGVGHLQARYGPMRSRYERTVLEFLERRMQD